MAFLLWVIDANFPERRYCLEECWAVCYWPSVTGVMLAAGANGAFYE